MILGRAQSGYGLGMESFDINRHCVMGNQKYMKRTVAYVGGKGKGGIFK